MNILEQARGIIYDKSEEKERQYGDFFENMEDAARIASVMSKKQFTAEDIYHALIGLKFARESFSHKHDNMLDAIAYIASLHEYKEKKTNNVNDIDVIDPIHVDPNDKKHFNIETHEDTKEDLVWSSDRLTGVWGSNYTTPLVTSDYVRNISMSPTYFTNVKKDS
jgi:hypothetical protein